MSHSGGRENRLARESSPYLLLHARNPVDWYPWGEEAFAEARRADKPIFLSVGYSTCYWCHVMEREVFSNEEIAGRMNEGFVNIKLDREERPELDEIYMTATQLLTRAGGWPNSLFLTHDLKPFYAGTYFPPHDGHGRPGFPRVLTSIREAWDGRRDSVLEQAEAVAEGMREQMSVATASATLPASSEAVGAALSGLARRFDPEWGGFGSAPKFPSPSNLYFLLDLAQGEAGDAEARGMLVATLDHMARGGIHDQIGGGFHRYSTDGEWLVPHFEKMLYDNAALALLYAEAAVSFAEPAFGWVARSTFEFVLAELTGPDGGFLSAIDAETDGHEGAYYTWTREDLEGILDPEAFKLLALVYGFGGSTNFERDRYVLHLPLPLAERARTMGLGVDDLRARMEPGRRALLDARWKRKRPLVDDKVLADWNGLMIAALARGGALLGEPRYVEAAARAARVVLERLEQPEGLRHGYRGDSARVPAVLDDYAFLIAGLLELHAAAPEPRWLEDAVRLHAEQDRRLWDPGAGGYFSAGEDPHLLFRAKTPYDGAVASGNGIAALNLLRLASLRGESYRTRAHDLLVAFGHGLGEWPLAHVSLLRALARSSDGSAPAVVADADAPAQAAAPSPLEATAHAVVELRGRVEAVAGAWKPFAVDLVIRSGWHVNANPASESFLIATEVRAVQGEIRSVRYPPGEALRTELSTREISVYGSLVRIEGEIEVAGDGAVEVEVIYQACDETRCLPPVTRRVLLH